MMSSKANYSQEQRKDIYRSITKDMNKQNFRSALSRTTRITPAAAYPYPLMFATREPEIRADPVDDDEEGIEEAFFTPHQHKPGNIFNALAIDDDEKKPKNSAKKSRSSNKRLRRREKAARTPKSKRENTPVMVSEPVVDDADQIGNFDEVFAVAPKQAKGKKSKLRSPIGDIPGMVSNPWTNLVEDFPIEFSTIRQTKPRKVQAKPVVMPPLTGDDDDVPDLLPMTEQEGAVDGFNIPASQTKMMDVIKDGVLRKEMVPRTKEIFNQYYTTEPELRALGQRINYFPRDGTKVASIKKYLIAQLYK